MTATKRIPKILPTLLAASAALTGGLTFADTKASGFSVNNHDRNQVVALWHSAYMASEGYESRIGWNGNHRGNPGAVSPAFAADVARRINYFRAMCGVPSVVKVNSGSTVSVTGGDLFQPAASTKKSAAAQAGALMLVRNYDPNSGANPAISHDPPKNLIGWSPAAWNAHANGNLAFGLFGPGAITEYMREEALKGAAVSVWNSTVGHRRWILAPRATDFATGDQPGDGPFVPPTNVLYIMQKASEENGAVGTRFVAYPAPGYFPAPVNSRFWSLSRREADFSKARVSVKDAAGNPVPILGTTTSPTYGDPAIVWEVGGKAAESNVLQDTRYDVRVSGILGIGVPPTYSYSVVLIHPDQLTVKQTLGGPRTASAKSKTRIVCPVVPGAESRSIRTYLLRPGTWTDGAETKKSSMVIDGTSRVYPLVANMSSFQGFGPVSGKKAFHLTFPSVYDPILRGVPDQMFELERLVVPKSNARLEFFYRRGFMTKASRLSVEASADGGVTWKPVGKDIRGASDNKYDMGASRAKFPLPKSKDPLRIRFRYFVAGASPIYIHDKKTPTGIFIDDIFTRNCDWLELAKTTTLAPSATEFPLSRATVGGKFRKGSRVVLGMSAQLGGHWFPPGPLKTVKVR